ncbi:Rieske (2Fe-2S) protein [Nocardioides sp. zg-ZUI104]|uniref:Rieske (2Fe-2S) protein n=1 Tax=Nocardioides faecalis TaxID=2803858 RepID=UPI001BD007D0|nr:Rieske (2Fe-2S) protein [Nocardioides faecalis]MBS4753959.1 Rieske (2Fe-2S) protein [Nocardioides faecalis]
MSARLSRRQTLAGVTTVALGLPVLSACAEGSTTATDPAPRRTPAPPSPPQPTSSAPATTVPASPGAGGALVAAADVPVGGGVVLKDAEIVVTQPRPGEFKAFSAICTHNRCLVSSVEDGEIVCPCHRSTFAVADGAHTGGPAAGPLPQVAVEVDGDQVVRG